MLDPGAGGIRPEARPGRNPPVNRYGGRQGYSHANPLERPGAPRQALAKRRGEIFEERYLPNLNAFRGAQDLVRKLHEHSLLLAVASSAEAKQLDPLLDIVGIRPFLNEKTPYEDAERSKPDPDIVAVALQRLGLKADEVIMVGDSRSVPQRPVVTKYPIPPRPAADTQWVRRWR